MDNNFLQMNELIINNNIDDNILLNNNEYNDLPDLIMIDNNIQNIENVENVENDLPLVHENNNLHTFNDLLGQLDNFIDKATIARHIIAHIDYIIFITHDPNVDYDNNQVNNILSAYNIANQHEYLDDEQQLLEHFKDIINQANFDQKKLIYNIFSGLPY
jgi:hypothetical protein